MAIPPDPAQWSNPGYFGPVTATLDWCESNYQFSYYIAELTNTFSNLFSIFLAIWSAVLAANQSLPTRYIVGYGGMALVGVGSFAFHASLLFQAQLADELPMIYVGAMSLWILFDVKTNSGIHLRVLLLALFDIIFTWSYMIYRNPIYHQIVFAIIVISTAVRVTYLLKWSELTSSIPDNTKSTIGTLFGVGASLFALGFLVWNLDNIYCDTLTSWKNIVGWPRAFALEGHSWWHILTGAGAHYMFVGIQYLTLCIEDHPGHYGIRKSLGFPHVYRTERKVE